MYAIYQEQGMRDYMEDTVDVSERFHDDLDFYAVFDGHGGDAVAKFLKANFKLCLIAHLKQHNSDVPVSLTHTFEALANILESKGFAKQMGSTALVMVKSPKTLWVANAGDCRAVLKTFDGIGYRGLALSTDHKPSHPSELERIRSLDGVVMIDPWGTWRVGGNLAVSRSFGDLYLSPWVTWLPEITANKLTKDMRAVILASDGVWDTISDNDSVAIAENVIKTNLMYDQSTVMKKVAQEIGKEAQRRGSGDNISVIFVIV